MILMVCYLDQPLEVLAQQLNTRSVLIILSVFQLAFLLPRKLVALLLLWELNLIVRDRPTRAIIIMLVIVRVEELVLVGAVSLY